MHCQIISYPVSILLEIDVGVGATQVCQSLADYNTAEALPAGANVLPDDSVDNGDRAYVAVSLVMMVPDDSPPINLSPATVTLTILDNDFGEQLCSVYFSQLYM